MAAKEDKRRVIVNYKNITEEQLKLLTDAYPYGIDEEDILSYVNSKGDKVETVPLETSDTKYLFKISVHLHAQMESGVIDEQLNIDEISESGESISE